MDIDQHVNLIVQNIVAEITTKVQSQVADIINQKVSAVVDAIDCTPILAEKLSQKLDIRLSQLPIDARSIETELTARIDNLANNLSATVKNKTLELITAQVNNNISNINFKDIFQTSIIAAIQNNQVTFPTGSIGIDSIDLTGLEITGDVINGGIVQNFGSTGIDDKATACQVTILDDMTVVENNLLTKDLTVKGTTTIEGDLNVMGSISESSPMYKKFVAAATNNVRTAMDANVFKGYADLVVKQLREDGMELDSIKINGQDVVSGPILGNFITISNLQQVGMLKELQVSGESFLSETLYSTRGRVGVNTIEPSQALSIWDQEVELGFGKLENNTAIISAPRSQKLVLGSNGKNNITLETDGSATVNKLNVGAVSMTSSSTPPSNDQPQGTIVFNSNPTLGGPLGWVSLGGARWANFGIID
jgi:hypothetical protein